MKNLAIIDDDTDSNLLLQLMLKGHYLVRVYEDPEIALDAIKKDPPDVILLDIEMPKISGEEILKRVRGSNELKAIPVIALTAYVLKNSRSHYLNLGFDEYISKPIVDEQVFIQTINQLFTHSK